MSDVDCLAQGGVFEDRVSAVLRVDVSVRVIGFLIGKPKY